MLFRCELKMRQRTFWQMQLILYFRSWFYWINRLEVLDSIDCFISFEIIMSLVESMSRIIVVFDNLRFWSIKAKSKRLTIFLVLYFICIWVFRIKFRLFNILINMLLRSNNCCLLMHIYETLSLSWDFRSIFVIHNIWMTNVMVFGNIEVQ